MLEKLGLAHYYQSLLRLGLAGLWLATQISPHVGQTNCAARLTESEAVARRKIVAGGELSMVSSGSGHVQHVIRKAWRRWCFATQMWLSSTEFQQRETEAWLAGE